ncbi:DUF3038 domain-containing protein [Waterburya agarophytonicola K14]|uniref:DUF3038 domain-containing protein n=1 Tax=Waterburya agarophytonicola KI4 TaxID=2874699 RepID=A0A964BN59_9CYAN|nr:DUF3038 domain-containing protein [Waterburya agarophytonicola KI4]
MSQPASLESDFPSPGNNSTSILNTLPDISLPTKNCSPRTQQQIDLLLLALEALELGGSEQMLAMARQLNMEEIIKHRVNLWRLRCSNPWRRSYTRDDLTLEQAKALVIIAGYRAKDLMVNIRQLLLAEQQMREKNLPLENHFRLSEYLERFRAHFRSRMNSRRAKVSAYIASEEQLNELALSLLNKLLFCTGARGMERVWFSLFDGEVT